MCIANLLQGEKEQLDFELNQKWDEFERLTLQDQKDEIINIVRGEDVQKESDELLEYETLEDTVRLLRCQYEEKIVESFFWEPERI